MIDPEEDRKPSRPRRTALIAAVLASTAFGVFYRVTVWRGLGHTALMFIGLPAVLAILLALTPRAKSATGAILRAITFALLILAPLLGEGFLCILIAAPIFYTVGILVGLLEDRRRRKRGVTFSCCVLLLVPMALEGVVPQLTFPRLQTVEVTRSVSGTPAQVEAALSGSPGIGLALPRFLRIGFPRPLESHGSGLAVGSTRTIHFAGAEGGPPGDLIVRVTGVRSGYLRTETVSDSTKVAHWLRWQSSEVLWKPLDPTHTAVTWRIHFLRELDPAWYFVPLERYAVKQAASFMIEENATPRPSLPDGRP